MEEVVASGVRGDDDGDDDDDDATRATAPPGCRGKGRRGGKAGGESLVGGVGILRKVGGARRRSREDVAEEVSDISL